MSVLTAFWLRGIEPQEWGFTLVTCLAIALAYSWLPDRHGGIPYINRPPKMDIFGQKTKKHFITNARSLMAEGRRLFKGTPYRMFTDLGDLIVIPTQFIDDVRNEPNLSFMQFFIDNFHPNIPGFDGFKFDGREDELLHRTINKTLTKLLSKDVLGITQILGINWTDRVILPLSAEASFATSHILGKSTEWQEVHTMDMILDLVAQLSSRVFLGTELCRNAEWLAITKSYSINTTAAGDLLRQFPS